MPAEVAVNERSVLDHDGIHVFRLYPLCPGPPLFRLLFHDPILFLSAGIFT